MRMKKSMFVAVVCLMMAFVLGLSGCKKEGSTEKSDKVKVGFILKTMQEERYQKDKKYFIDKAELMGAQVVFDSCNNNEQTQLAKFENMIAKGVDVIVLQPVNTGTAGNMVKMAQQEGVRVVGYDSMLQNGPLEVHIMHDAFAVGEVQAQALVKWLKDKKGSAKGDIVIIKGQAGDSYANDLTDGVKSVLKDYPNIKIVGEQSHDGWSPDKAMATAENILSKRNNQVDAFLCNNSGMARGVISALKAQKLASSDKVFVAGADADLINVRYVAQEIQAIDVYAAIQPLAEIAAETAVTMAKNKDKKADELLTGYKVINNGYQDVVTIMADIYEVNKDTIKDTVVKFGYLTEDEIYGSN